jgi:hypothetical protein
VLRPRRQQQTPAAAAAAAPASLGDMRDEFMMAVQKRAQRVAQRAAMGRPAAAPAPHTPRPPPLLAQSLMLEQMKEHKLRSVGDRRKSMADTPSDCTPSAPRTPDD